MNTPDTVKSASNCSNCSLRELCLPQGLSPQEMERLDGLVARRVTVRRGEPLYRSGQDFECFYAIRSGFFKTRTVTSDGREHVNGFQMTGDLLGLDGLSTDRHSCDAIALEDAQVCVIPYLQLQELLQDFSQLQRALHRAMGREIVRDHGLMRLLAGMPAIERLASFVLHLSRRLEARGQSARNLVLRMTREEIGTFLGLKLETVSRCFSRLQDDGILRVRHKHVEIVDLHALQSLAGALPT